MQRFKSPEQAHRFLSSFGLIYDYFHPKKHKLPANQYRQQLSNRFAILMQFAV